MAAVAGAAGQGLLAVEQAAWMMAAAAWLMAVVAAAVAAALVVVALFAVVAAVVDGEGALFSVAEVVVFVFSGTLRYGGNWMAAGIAVSTLKCWKGNLAVFSFLTAESSSGKKAVCVRGVHGGPDLWGAAWMTSEVDRHLGGVRMNAFHTLHGACGLWKKNDVVESNHHAATGRHLEAHHSHGRCV